MIPGEILPASGYIELNAGAPVVTLLVANRGDRPIQVGSHYHFGETNEALDLDRAAARGMRLDIATHELIVHTSRTKRSTDFVAFLDEIDRRYGPKPGRAERPVVLVLDNGPIHTSKLTAKALGQRNWLTVEWLPRYAPELNDIEIAWRDLKRHHLAHRTFADADHLDQTIHQGVKTRNRERAHPCDNLRIAA